MRLKHLIIALFIFLVPNMASAKPTQSDDPYEDITDKEEARPTPTPVKHPRRQFVPPPPAEQCSNGGTGPDCVLKENEPPEAPLPRVVYLRCKFGEITDYKSKLTRCRDWKESAEYQLAYSKGQQAGIETVNSYLGWTVLTLGISLLVTLFGLFGFLKFQAIRNGHYGPFKEDDK